MKKKLRAPAIEYQQLELEKLYYFEHALKVYNIERFDESVLTF